MKLLIKNPAPTDSRLKKWGDFHFGRSLAKYLERNGCEVVTQYFGQWDQAVPADAQLVLRGRHAFIPPADSSMINLIWVISHPDDVSAEELKAYDRVYVASESLARLWRKNWNVDAQPMLQCSDTEQFQPGTGTVRRDVIFVGNTRGERRPLVEWAQAAGLRPRVWGRGWEQTTSILPEADYYENEQLSTLYNSARLTLNDHWPDMVANGMVNNRVFDALACGLPVLSDFNPGLEQLGLPGVISCRTKEDFLSAVVQYRFDYPQLLRDADTARERIEEHFSFASRAKTIIEDMTTFGR